jgi:Na+-driven multidrug efflux pump
MEIELDSNEIRATPPPESPSEDIRMSQWSPAPLLLWLSSGPFLGELVAAAFSFVDSFWISRACGEVGLAAVSLSSLFDSIGRAFGVLCNVASSCQLSKLRGENEHEAIPQLLADLLRLCFLIGAICPLVILPIVKPLMRGLFEANDEITDAGFEYVLPMVSGSVITCLNQMLCGVLQSESRSLIYGAIQVSNFLLNMLVFDPLFLLGFKMGMFGAGLATVCSELLPLIVLLFFFFRGKFETKTTCSNLMSCFTKNSWEAIQTGITQFISHVCFSLPSFFSRKFVSLGAEQSGKYTEMLAAYNSVLKCWAFALSFVMALTRGLLPAASFAIGAHNPRRVRLLFFWASFIALVWCAFTELILLTCGRYIARIFGDSDEFIEASATMIRNSYALQVVAGQGFVTIPLLQAMAYKWTAIVFSILTQFCPVPLFGAILYFTDAAHDVFRQMWMYSLNDAFSLVVALVCAIVPLIQLQKEAEGVNTEILEPMNRTEEEEFHEGDEKEQAL